MGKKRGQLTQLSNGPCMLRRERWLDLPDQQIYPGFKLLVWVNHPARLWNQVIGGKDNAEIGPVLAQIAREHNGWREPDGTPFPPISDPAFWETIPNELASQVFLAVLETYKSLPNPSSGTSASSESGSKPATKEE